MRRLGERGQAMYIVSVALLTMILVVALAVDSGLAYLRAQQAQSIAEAAARAARPALPDCARAAQLAAITVNAHKPRRGADLASQSACDDNNAGITITVLDSFPVFFAQLIGSGSQRHITRTAHVSAPPQAHEHLTVSAISVEALDCNVAPPAGEYCLVFSNLPDYANGGQPPSNRTWQAGGAHVFCRNDPTRSVGMILHGFRYDFSQARGDQQGPLPVWIESYARYPDGTMAVLQGRRVNLSGPGGQFVDETRIDAPNLSAHQGPWVGMVHFRLSWYDQDATPHFAVSPTLYFTC